MPSVSTYYNPDTFFKLDAHLIPMYLFDRVVTEDGDIGHVVGFGLNDAIVVRLDVRNITTIRVADELFVV